MKKILCIFIVLYSLQGFSQTEKGNEYKELNRKIDSIEKICNNYKRINDSLIIRFENKDKELYEISDKIRVLDSSLTATNGLISDGRLKESLEVAESTLNKQNYWIESFGVIYTVITIVLVILPILLYFIQIRPLIQSAKETSNNANQANRDANQANRDANTAIQSLNDRINQLDMRIESQLNLSLQKYSEKIKIDSINQIIDELTCPNAFLRDQAAYRLNSHKKSDLSEHQIYRLLDILNQYLADSSIEETIIYFLTKHES